MATVLDEVAYRRPAWDVRSAVDPITLCDGQDWLFPKPVLAVPVADGGWMPTTAVVADPKFDAILRRLEGRELLAPFEAAVYLLSVVYDLPDDAYPALLEYRPRDEDNQEMWRQILDVAQGEGVRTVDLWSRATRILTGGPRGPMLLEEANACVTLAVKAGRVLQASKYVQEMIDDAESAKLRSLWGG
jgi:hypothetical protein